MAKTQSRNYLKRLAQPLPEVMDYNELTQRLHKTLYYGMLLRSTNTFKSSFPLTNDVVEKFSQTDSNLFLEKLCFDYAADVSRETCLSPCSLVLALIYLERLCQKNPNFVSSIPSSKLFLISVMLASKFLNDEGQEDEVVNSDWANSAKIDLAELNQLEKQFLQAIDWALYVDDEDFTSALEKIEFRVAQRESLKRNWLTYTELDILARQKLLIETWKLVHNLVINVSLACMTAYLASLMTLYCGVISSAVVVSSLPWNARIDNHTFVPVETEIEDLESVLDVESISLDTFVPHPVNSFEKEIRPYLTVELNENFTLPNLDLRPLFDPVAQLSHYPFSLPLCVI